ncbi:MAG: NAD(P)H-binding protein [Crocinitomicaceae bacterium]|nr:NAD(P)H-binding protein [Crocinitomicaceae bacterium]
MSVTIIGCGWLGLSLGKALVEDGKTVFGSVRKTDGFASLTKAGVIPFQLNLDQSTKVPEEIVEVTSVLVITLPPLHRDAPRKYRKLLNDLLEQFSREIKVIFTSTTGIYPRVAGNFVESFKFNFEQDSTVVNAAEIVIRQSKLSHVILRLGGLIGPNRHPIRFLQGRKGVKNPEGRINFVHQGDCIRAIRQTIENNEVNGTFNLVNPRHPKRKIYYSEAAKHYQLEAPQFEDEEEMSRIISSKKITQELGFEFKFPIDVFPELHFD